MSVWSYLKARIADPGALPREWQDHSIFSCFLFLSLENVLIIFIANISCTFASMHASCLDDMRLVHLVVIVSLRRLSKIT